MKLTKFAFSLAVVAGAFLASTAAFASDGVAGGSSLAPIGAGVAIGLAALGGALGQSRAASAALEGMARNPQVNPMALMIVGLALMDSLVILAFLVAYKILG